ncbi:MAG: glycosyltransferase family 2 protein [Candidatus Eisenbacteria bacterium]|nr:glycosyltransferase family 2 protein [Candidatus Eisenbacteria bacterium]
MPRLSVLLPVRNASPWLAASLRSLWRQTFTDFEVVAVDDGSTDGSAGILDAESTMESRLRVIHTAPRGLPAALNTALGHSLAPLLARHDADDLSHRERFALQVAHFEAHADVDVCGTRVRLFPEKQYGEGMRRWTAWHNSLLTHEQMHRELLIDSPLCHGTALMRREALERVGGWQEQGWAEDLDLWIRLAESGARFGKLPRALYGWRQHDASSTRTDGRYARERFTELKVAALDRTLLQGGRRARLIGVGESLQRWRAALGERVARSIEARAPLADLERDDAAPAIIALVAPAARERWRAALTRAGWSETLHFIFVA